MVQPNPIQEAVTSSSAVMDTLPLHSRQDLVMTQSDSFGMAGTDRCEHQGSNVHGVFLGSRYEGRATGLAT